VAQIVLNRTRHAAYPKTICGVVFQGSERSTGCQFTFTCDGSLNRAPSRVAWRRAAAIARAALGGHVVPEVGQATHYHATWMTPYWAPSLPKVATIGGHAFYRWGTLKDRAIPQQRASLTIEAAGSGFRPMDQNADLGAPFRAQVAHARLP
jgi:spore germination cell wall hydrolase CwlJ-like protein